MGDVPGRERAAIQASEVSRSFSKHKVLDRVSFRVGQGEIFCIIGPNGAGKTTLMSIVSTLLHPSEGTVLVAGFDVRRQGEEVRKQIGVVFQEYILDDDLTVFDNLDIHARLFAIPDRRARIMDLLRLVDLEPKAQERARTLSGGMKRRLELARGLLGGPKILLLDEPTLGLDPVAKRRFLEHVRSLNKNGMTVLVNTNDMSEAEFLSHQVLFLNHGRVIAQGSVDHIKKHTKQKTLEDAFIALAAKEDAQ